MYCIFSPRLSQTEARCIILEHILHNTGGFNEKGSVHTGIWPFHVLNLGY